MKLQRDHWPLRLMGVLFGLGCLVVGLTGGIGVGPSDRVDFVIITITTGLIATFGSLITKDIIGFWYCNDKRLAARRAREARRSDLSTGS